MEKHLDYLQRRRKKIFDHLMAIHQPERMSIQALDDVAEFIRNEYPVIKNMGVDLFSYDCPEKLYDEVSAKVRKYRRQQRVRRFMSNVYKEDKGLWSEEVAYWLDQLFQNSPSKKVVKELRERLAAIKSAEDLAHTLKVTINNHFGTGDFPPIDGTSLQKVYQDNRWMLLEAWSASDIRSLTGNRWCIAGVGTFNDYTFEGFARSYVLYQKKPKGDMEIIAFHVENKQGVAHIKCAFDESNLHCENHLEKVLESAPAPLRGGIRGFTEEDVYQKPELWIAYIDLGIRNIKLSSVVYQKLLRDWLDGSNPAWKKLKDHYKGVIAQNLLFFAQQHRDIEGFLNVIMYTEESLTLPDWNDLLARWCLNDKNPPTVSAEVIKRFVEEIKDRHISGIAMMDLLMVSSRLAPDVTRGDLLKQAHARRNGFPSFLNGNHCGEGLLFLEGEKEGETLRRPEWVKSTLSELLESVPEYGIEHLSAVIKTENRWMGDGLTHDAQWNQRLLDATKVFQKSSGLKWGSSYDERYLPIYKRLIKFPEVLRLFREDCREAKEQGWLWRFSRDFDHPEIRALFSEPVLNQQSMNELIKSAPAMLRDKGQHHFGDYYQRNDRADLMLSLIFEQADRSLSTPREALLSALYGNSKELKPMCRALSVVVRDKSVRLDKGAGWEKRLNFMKCDPQVLKGLLTSNRLNLDESDKMFLSHGHFVSALAKCSSSFVGNNRGMECAVVKKSELVDAYVDSFGVSALHKVWVYQRQQRVRRFMSTIYRENRGLWSEEVAYWLDRLFQNDPSKKMVHDLQKRLIAIKCADDLVHTLKVSINNHFGTGEFPPINGTSLQMLYQDDRWMLLEAWSAGDIKSLVGDQWCTSDPASFKEETFENFSRSHVLYRKKTDGGMEIIGFHMKDDQGVARIRCAFDYGGDHCEGRLEQVLESAPKRLRDSLKGFTTEDILRNPIFWISRADFYDLNIKLPEDVYQKMLNQWVDGSYQEWDALSYDSKRSLAQNLLFTAWQYRDIEGFLSVVMSSDCVDAVRGWQNLMAIWYLSDDNPPAVSTGTMNRFLSENNSHNLIGTAFVDLVILSSRLAPEVPTYDLLVQINGKENRFSSLVKTLTRHFISNDLSACRLWGVRQQIRPGWVKSALYKLLDYAPEFGDDCLLCVLLAEDRWFGDKLYHDAQWNQRLLNAAKGIEERFQKQPGRSVRH